MIEATETWEGSRPPLNSGFGTIAPERLRIVREMKPSV
jgi:hypothetical protein